MPHAGILPTVCCASLTHATASLVSYHDVMICVHRPQVCSSACWIILECFGIGQHYMFAELVRRLASQLCTFFSAPTVSFIGQSLYTICMHHNYTTLTCPVVIMDLDATKVTTCRE